LSSSFRPYRLCLLKNNLHRVSFRSNAMSIRRRPKLGARAPLSILLGNVPDAVDYIFESNEEAHKQLSALGVEREESNVRIPTMSAFLLSYLPFQSFSKERPDVIQEGDYCLTWRVIWKRTKAAMTEIIVETRTTSTRTEFSDNQATASRRACQMQA
jgi:hypothetical protein